MEWLKKCRHWRPDIWSFRRKFGIPSRHYQSQLYLNGESVEVKSLLSWDNRCCCVVRLKKPSVISKRPLSSLWSLLGSTSSRSTHRGYCPQMASIPPQAGKQTCQEVNFWSTGFGGIKAVEMTVMIMECNLERWLSS